VFLLNSWLHHFTETASLRLALFRSYSHNLPSSFSTAHPSALEYSSRLPVSVYGTSCIIRTLEVFLGSLITVTIHATEALWYYQVSSIPADLPTRLITTPFNELFRQFADLSLLRYSIEYYTGMGILTHFPSTSPFGYA
jgi:hypothetical protein